MAVRCLLDEMYISTVFCFEMSNIVPLEETAIVRHGPWWVAAANNNTVCRLTGCAKGREEIGFIVRSTDSADLSGKRSHH
jgi:hypothetical protein